METVKIYCFQYDTNKKRVFRQEYDTEEDKYGYDLLDPDNHEYCFRIRKDDVNTVQVHNDHEGNKIVYIYSAVDDVNLALSVINEAFETNINSIQKQLNELRMMHSLFKEERDRIKETYPNGRKES